MKEKAYYIGLTLIIISFIACVISFYLLVFGIPTFLVGAILVFLSKNKIQVKLITTLTPIALYIPLTFLFLYVYNYSTPKTILIPKDFDGNLRVVYEEKCGHNYDNTDGVKTLTFPENGILILNEEFDRHINYKYYLVDDLGNRTEIPQILDFKSRVQKGPYALVGCSGTIGQSIEANTTNQEEKGITYSDFYVYNKDTVDRRDYKSQQKIDSLTNEAVDKCRKNNGHTQKQIKLADLKGNWYLNKWTSYNGLIFNNETVFIDNSTDTVFTLNYSLSYDTLITWSGKSNKKYSNRIINLTKDNLVLEGIREVTEIRTYTRTKQH